MTLLAAAAATTTTTTTEATTTTTTVEFPLPRSASSAPWNSSLEPCSIQTFDGSGSTIHPSVVDMGEKWNGYRWWMANTPYPNYDAVLEDPDITASNDRLTWVHPPGLAQKPLRLNPGFGYHSDTELAWDPEGERLVCLYRFTSGVTNLHASSSANGLDWTYHGVVLENLLWPSPSVVRVAANSWRMYFHNGSSPAPIFAAATPLGPWTQVGTTSRVTPALGEGSGWHGDFIFHEGLWYWACSHSNNAPANVWLSTSVDGILWSQPSVVMTGGAGGWDDHLYRTTIEPSTEPGFMDMWYSGISYSNPPKVPFRSATDYVRLPLSLWPTPPNP